MKRLGDVFDAIAERSNLLLAVEKALRGKRRRPEAAAYLDGLDANLTELSDGLRDGTFQVGRYEQFVIRDPKERVITAPVFAERVMHHAVMNVLEPHVERWLIADTFACRPGKGRDAAVERAAGFARSHGWFLCMDVRKYFDSICHARLKEMLRRKLKDARLVALLDRVIDGYRGDLGKGLPIGSLTSQHLANLYLDPFDRFVKETLRVRGYVRYMDDIALWGHDRKEMGEAKARCAEHLGEHLGMEVKPTAHVNRTRHGMDFLGVRLFATYRILNRRSRVRYRRRLLALDAMWEAGEIGDGGYQRRVTALTAFATGAGVSSLTFRRATLSSATGGDHTARTA